MSTFSAETRLNESTSRIISYGLVALMLTCVSLTFSSLLQHIFYNWQSGATAGLALFVVLERLYTYRRYSKLTIFSSEWFSAFGVQFIVSVVVMRIVVSLSHGVNAFMADTLLLINEPVAYLFAPEFMAVFMIAFILWFVAGYFAELLEEMGLYQSLIARELHAAVQRDTPPARERLLGLVFSLGSVLVIFTAITRVNLRGILERTGDPIVLSLGSLEAGGASTLLYFMLGLALLSQSQFVNLFTRWSLGGTPVSTNMARKWAQYSLVFLVLLAGVVSLLPTSYSLGFLNMLGYVLDIILRVIFFVGQIILTVLIFLVSLPFLLMGKEPPVEGARPEAFEMPEFQPPAQPETAASASFLQTLWPFISWGLLLVILGFAFVQFLRQHEELLASLRRLPGGKWLAGALEWLLGFFRTVKTGISEAIEAGRERLRARRAIQKEMSGGWMNIRKLDPRQKVRFFYLALIRRSGEHGLTRGLSQTPLEYADTLERALPESDADIDALTDEFIKARYSRQPVPDDEANLVRRLWERIRKALRKK